MMRPEASGRGGAGPSLHWIGHLVRSVSTPRCWIVCARLKRWSRISMPTLCNGRPLSATSSRSPGLRTLRSLPAAETHGNEIEADALEDYVDALIAERLATEPLLLTHAAEALRRDSAALPDEDAGEFRELGGSDRLEELTDGTWDGMDTEDKRLVAITLLESVLVDPEGGTVADRLSVAWRF